MTIFHVYGKILTKEINVTSAPVSWTLIRYSDMASLESSFLFSIHCTCMWRCSGLVVNALVLWIKQSESEFKPLQCNCDSASFHPCVHVQMGIGKYNVGGNPANGMD